MVPVPSESRKRRKQEPEPAVDPEHEQDAWDEFAADYYESELTVRLWTVPAVPNRRAQCIPIRISRPPSRSRRSRPRASRQLESELLLA